MSAPATTERLAGLGPRFWSKVDKVEGGCWTWMAARSGGYGCYSIKHISFRAHRLAYEELVGPIPSGLVLDHLCRNRACVNPDHLDPVTNEENVKRGAPYRVPEICNPLHERCCRGHEFTPDNTIVRRSRRLCRACEKLRDARKQARTCVCPHCGVTRNWWGRWRHLARMHPAALWFTAPDSWGKPPAWLRARADRIGSGDR